jgi:hypothetical protein
MWKQVQIKKQFPCQKTFYYSHSGDNKHLNWVLVNLLSRPSLHKQIISAQFVGLEYTTPLIIAGRTLRPLKSHLLWSSEMSRQVKGVMVPAKKDFLRQQR